MPVSDAPEGQMYDPDARPVGAISPGKDGTELWADSGFLFGRIVNLCGLWISRPEKLFEWRPVHFGLSRLIAIELLYESHRRLGHQTNWPDLFERFRASAREAVFDAEDDLFVLSGGELGFAGAEVHSALSYPEESESGEETLGEWVFHGGGVGFEQWKTKTVFTRTEGLYSTEGRLWSLARCGYLEVRCRVPDPFSEPRILEPDVFLTDGRIIAGEAALELAGRRVWAVQIRANPCLALPGMIEGDLSTGDGAIVQKKTINRKTLETWLAEFNAREGRKATRDEVEAALSDRYRTSSLRLEYTKMPNYLKRVRGERR